MDTQNDIKYASIMTRAESILNADNPDLYNVSKNIILQSHFITSSRYHYKNAAGVLFESCSIDTYGNFFTTDRGMESDARCRIYNPIIVLECESHMCIDALRNESRGTKIDKISLLSLCRHRHLIEEKLEVDFEIHYHDSHITTFQQSMKNKSLLISFQPKKLSLIAIIRDGDGQAVGRKAEFIDFANNGIPTSIF